MAMRGSRLKPREVPAVDDLGGREESGGAGRSTAMDDEEVS